MLERRPTTASVRRRASEKKKKKKVGRCETDQTKDVRKNVAVLNLLQAKRESGGDGGKGGVV